MKKPHRNIDKSHSGKLCDRKVKKKFIFTPSERCCFLEILKCLGLKLLKFYGITKTITINSFSSSAALFWREKFISSSPLALELAFPSHVSLTSLHTASTDEGNNQTHKKGALMRWCSIVMNWKFSNQNLNLMAESFFFFL